MAVVTVCIPTYEPKPEHLQAAVDCALKQTFSDWELIIHDDASKSDVESIVKPHLTDKRIRFFRSAKNLGIGGNWNAAMQKGSAPFVAYLFQDDLWHSEYLQRSLNILMRQTDVGFTAVNHDYRIEGATAATATGIYKEVEDLRKEIMADGRIVHAPFMQMWLERGLRPNLIGEPSFVVLRRELMERAGPFLEDMKQGLDAEYWIRCLLLSDAWWIAGILGSFRVHASAATAKNEESGAGRMDRLRTFRILINALPAGALKTLARRIRRRELLKMVGKFGARLVHYRR